MRRNLCALAMLAAALILPSVARAESSVSHFRGISAYGSFWNVDSTGCTSTYADVSVYENSYRTPPAGGTATSVVYIAIYQYDSCQGVFLNELYGYAELPAGAFDTRGRLDRAQLTANLQVYDYLSGTTVPVSVDLTWNGAGDVYRSSFNTRSSSGYYRYSAHSTGSYRQASLAGSVTFGGTVLVPDSNTWATLNESQGGTVTVWRQPH